jgi:cytochrome c biogenesis protein CcmG/thiol:disulfide interchange protein DsbE
MQRPKAGGLSAIAIAVVVGALLIARLGTEPVSPVTLSEDRTGALAEDFTVRLFDGGTFTLSNHLATDGRPVLINFWASWCIPCKAEMPALQQYAETHPEILLLGISTDSDEESAREFADSVGVTYPLSRDHDGLIAERFEVNALPTTLLLNNDGQIVGTVFGELDEADLDQLLERLD